MHRRKPKDLNAKRKANSIRYKEIDKCIQWNLLRLKLCIILYLFNKKKNASDLVLYGIT